MDCAQILIAVYSAVGIIKEFETGYYPSDWMLHRSEEQSGDGSTNMPTGWNHHCQGTSCCTSLDAASAMAGSLSRGRS